MDINVITSLISSVGFPIIACVFMYKQNTSTLEEIRKTIENNTKSINELKEELARKSHE